MILSKLIASLTAGLALPAAQPQTEFTIIKTVPSFLSNNKSKEYLSNTGITFKICEDWYLSKNEDDQKLIVKQICKILSEENIAYDINGYAKAPPSFRVWGGGTVEPDNIKLLLPWLEWAYIEIKGSYA